MKDYTIEKARDEFTPRLRWGQVLEVAERFGLTEWSARRLVETGAVTRILYPGRTRAYYDRDEVLRVVLAKNQDQEERI